MPGMLAPSGCTRRHAARSCCRTADGAELSVSLLCYKGSPSMNSMSLPAPPLLSSACRRRFEIGEPTAAVTTEAAIAARGGEFATPAPHRALRRQRRRVGAPSTSSRVPSTRPGLSGIWKRVGSDTYKQRLQQLFFPEGIAYDRKSIQSNRRNGTAFQLFGAVRGC